MAKQPTPQWHELVSVLSPRAAEQMELMRQPDKGKSQQPPLQWFVVEVPDIGPFRVTTCTDVFDVRDRLQSLEGQEVRCAVFLGRQAFITRKPFRRLVLDDGTIVPLFGRMEIADIDAEGYLGDEQPITRTPPPTAAEAAAEYRPVEEETPDETDGEDEEGEA